MNAPELKRAGCVAPRVDLVLTGNGQVNWNLGDKVPAMIVPGARPWPDGASLEATPADALLFWDAELGQPDLEVVLKFASGCSDLWHAGLCLGTRSSPGLLDFVQPTWMFNCDPSTQIEATSWRISLRACLVRAEVIRRMGFLRTEFCTVEGAALEWGHRLITRGVLMRSVPGLLPQVTRRTSDESGLKAEDHGSSTARLPFSDELRFIYYRYGRKWAAWAALRAVVSGYVSMFSAIRAWRGVMSVGRPTEPPPFRVSRLGDQPSEHRSSVPDLSCPVPSRVSVVIPTIRRYPYLRTLLGQLRTQTVAPVEILIVDQTPKEQRDYGIAEGFADLPIRLMHQDEPGQCTSRNTALVLATGDYILFVDDDDEVAPDLIARHLRALARFEGEVSCGVVEDKESGPPSGTSLVLRASDVFPTNNTLIRKDVLRRSGLFDIAYDRGARADGDLGMRIYLAGAQMVLDPEICLFHHHAPQGGLRVHGARVITRTSSRSQLRHRHLPSPTELYLARRYFSPRQVRESKWIRVLGTFSSRGGLWKRVAKVVVSFVMLPATVWRICANDRKAKDMLGVYPAFPKLERDTRSRTSID